MSGELENGLVWGILPCICCQECCEKREKKNEGFFLASLPPPAHSPCWESCVLAWVKGGGQDDR